MKKIVFTIDVNSSGGAERVTSLLANYFNQHSYDVTVINSDVDSSFYPLDKGVKVVKMGLDYNTGTSYKRFLYKYRFLRNYFRKEKPDAVVTFLFHMEAPTILAALSTRTHVFTSVRNSAFSYSKGVRTFRKIFYPLIAGVVFQSDKVMEFADFKKIKHKRVIMNPLSLEMGNKKIVDYQDRKHWIINVGRLNGQKNQKLLIDAFAIICDKYPEYTLHIYGSGNLEAELETYIEEQKLIGRVILEGEILNAISLHRDAYTFALSSDFEGFPNALAEAMANGIPSVSTDFDSGVAAQLIKNGENGYLCPVGEKMEMAKQLDKILALPQNDYMQMANKAQKTCDELDINIIGQQWESFCFE